MQTVQTNPCIRCGKQRIVVRVVEELISGSRVLTTEMSCPDRECQGILDKKHEQERVEKEKLKDSAYKVRTHWTQKKEEE